MIFILLLEEFFIILNKLGVLSSESKPNESESQLIYQKIILPFEKKEYNLLTSEEKSNFETAYAFLKRMDKLPFNDDQYVEGVIKFLKEYLKIISMMEERKEGRLQKISKYKPG